MFPKNCFRLSGTTRRIAILLLLLTGTVITEDNGHTENNFNAAKEKIPPSPTADGNASAAAASIENSFGTATPNAQNKSKDVIESFLLSHAVIPDVLAVASSHVLEVAYSRRSIINFGNKLEPALLQKKPRHIVWPWTNGSFYSLVLVDADVPSRKARAFAERIHWLVVNIPNNHIDEGEHVIEYIGPIVTPRSGMHRYIFAMFKQPGRIEYEKTKISAQSNRMSRDRLYFHIQEFAAYYRLHDPIAVNFFLGGWPLDQPVPIVTLPTKESKSTASDVNS
ncbi:unnamed protein product [Bemisia tabaci]|uniref:Phosphatidylethanolamine-binding protein n=1 Tax=Bemisia tabaci TaxID=7038 RepID=A0A9P0A4I9_BEMTA|nr:unnamed protein product [Bemisia tabaci]